MKPVRVSIIGLGLIGGSMALALRRNKSRFKVYGVESNPTHRRIANKRRLVEKILTLDEALKSSDILVVATPVDRTLTLIPQILSKMVLGQTCMDVGSAKFSICQKVLKHKKRDQFVATHPMAGTEHSGPEAAFASLFDHGKTVICDVHLSNPVAQGHASLLYRFLKMDIIYMDSREHDLHTAYISHLSHITSFVLANTVLRKEKNARAIFNLAGGGFESTVRLAKSSPSMWTPIFEQNQQYVTEALDAYIDQMKLFRASIAKQKWNLTSSLIKKANDIKKNIKGYPNTRAKGMTSYLKKLKPLRSGIQKLDNQLISLLAKRQRLTHQVGQLKSKHKIPVFQKSFWKKKLAKLLKTGGQKNLSRQFLNSLFKLIHGESVKTQKKTKEKK